MDIVGVYLSAPNTTFTSSEERGGAELLLTLEIKIDRPVTVAQDSLATMQNTHFQFNVIL